MTTAERRAAILQQLAHAGAPIAARTLATHYGVSRQVIVQDLAVIRASHPGIISTARGYVLEQPDQPAGCTREFKVRHTPDQTGQELNLIVDCGGRVKNISISHRVDGRITAEMDIRSRQDVREFLQSFEDSSSTVLSTATDGYHYHLVEAATPDEAEPDRKRTERARFSGSAATVGALERKRGIIMTVHELQQEILRLKREKNICILAHAYQSQPVLEVADYTGDSYGLSVQAAKTNADGVIMCGVRFMAETCKILSPEKTVWLANPMAGCPMAEQLDLPTLQELKKQYPGYAVVAYINTTSELKTACDVA